MDSIANHFRPKYAGSQNFVYAISELIYDLKIFPRVIHPYRCRNAPGASTQTPISTWLQSVAIVPILRSDHWCNSTQNVQSAKRTCASKLLILRQKLSAEGKGH